jgi:hypothetical protein
MGIASRVYPAARLSCDQLQIYKRRIIRKLGRVDFIPLTLNIMLHEFIPMATKHSRGRLQLSYLKISK